MPPVMGLQPLMAEFTGFPYGRIITAAAIPALLYYFGVWSGAFRSQTPEARGLTGMNCLNLKTSWYQGTPSYTLLAIIYLLVSGRTPMKAALCYCIIHPMLNVVKNTRIGLKDIIGGRSRAQVRFGSCGSHRLCWYNYRVYTRRTGA